MASQGATLQNYNNELVKSIEDLREKREELNRQILKEEEDKAKIQKELSILTDRLQKVNESLVRKTQARNEYDKTIQETEAAYMKILESSQTLLHVLKRETVNLTKKKQGVWHTPPSVGMSRYVTFHEHVTTPPPKVSVTLTDGRVLVGVLMAVDRHVNIVLCNTEEWATHGDTEYRKYKVKGKPEGKELKRMLGFIVVRGTGILYIQPEELGKEERWSIRLDATGATMNPAAALLAGMRAPLVNPLLAAGLRPGGLPGLPSMPGAGKQKTPSDLTGFPGEEEQVAKSLLLEVAAGVRGRNYIFAILSVNFVQF
ncbi:unnamed protein product [Durusdinium trenchii]|uniref:Sm domain-containing protein n=1 Tax=Durusdinium trenchii TaxID=1381693 RepID=A0ABP0J5G2_9DINO